MRETNPGCPSRDSLDAMAGDAAWDDRMTHSNRKLSLHKSATYRIRVQGQLEESWAPCLGGMAVRTVTSREQGPVTTLEGILLDQAALAGVLTTLYSLHLPLLLVEYVPTET